MSTESTEKRGLLGLSAFEQTMDDYNPISDGTLLSRGRFNLYLGLCLLWGFVVNAGVCLFYSRPIIAFASQHTLAFFVGYIVLALAGIIMSAKSDKPAISFLGYNLVVLPLGAVLSVIVAYYPVLTVGAAFLATASVSVVMVVLSSAKPDFFLKLGTVLFIALIACILVEVVLMLLGFNLGFIDWVVALVFCGYIGYDWARAQRVPPTLDNAIDCACSLYLDIINLFIRLLSILGNNRN